MNSEYFTHAITAFVFFGLGFFAAWAAHAVSKQKLDFLISDNACLELENHRLKGAVSLAERSLRKADERLRRTDQPRDENGRWAKG